MTATAEHHLERHVTKPTVPMWLAVCITVAVALPFGTYLGQFNFTLWISFVVWAEYFVFGANPEAFKTIFPCFTAGALWTGVMIWLATPFSFLPTLFAPGDLAMQAAFFVGGAVLVYAMDYVKIFQSGSLAYFNGMTMCIATVFSGAAPKIDFVAAHPQAATFWAAIWCVAMGWFGAFLGWFNIVILFPREVKQ